jgi:hypothetical protein
MSELRVSLEGLYFGFLRAYGSLCLPSEYWSRKLETHQVIAYFARLGSMLGYIPYCENKRRDLEWLEPGSDPPRTILHFESENSPRDAARTLKEDLGGSDAEFRIGYFEVDSKSLEALEEALRYVSQKQPANYLVIAKVNPAERGYPTHNEYDVQAWQVSPTKKKPSKLRSATLVWPHRTPGGTVYVKISDTLGAPA